MKFNKQLSNGGLFLPSAALKISGFEDSGQVEIHALKNTAVIMKQQMTAMELIQALDSLNQLFINLSFHLAKTCAPAAGVRANVPLGILSTTRSNWTMICGKKPAFHRCQTESLCGRGGSHDYRLRGRI